MANLRETRDSLWLLTIAPGIWAAHFLLSYATAAVWCAKVAGPGGPLAGARAAIAIYTGVALAGIALTAFVSHGKWRSGIGPADPDSVIERRRFLGFASFLLSALSLVATLYVTMAVALIRDCN